MPMRVVAAVAVLAGLLAGGAARAGEDLAIEAFSGQFVGTGIAENEQSESLALTLRDLDVRITPDDGGKDVFVHVTAVESAGMGPLVEGQKINFEVISEPRGLKAVDLSAAEAAAEE